MQSNDEIYSYGRQQVNLGVIIINAVILIQFFSFFIPGLLNKTWATESDSFFVVSSLLFGALYPPFAVLLWYNSFKIIMLASRIFHLLAGRSTCFRKWQETTCNSLWTLPYAVAAGAVIYLIYINTNLGGWPGDVIFGTLANLLGAFCYSVIFFSWFKLIKTTSRDKKVVTITS